MNWLGLGLGLVGGAVAERVARGRVGLGEMPEEYVPVSVAEMTDVLVELSDGGSMHYLDSHPDGAPGGGTTIVLLHGVTLNAEIWHHQFVLAGQHRVISIDLRSHGASIAGTDGPGIPANAADLAWLLEHLDLERVVLVGHSMGGMIVGRFIADHSEVWQQRVGGLVFVSTAGRRPRQVPRPLLLPLVGPLRAASRRFPALANRIGDVPDNDLGEAFVRASFGDSPRPNDLRLTIDAFEAMDVEQFLAIAPSLLEHDVLEGLAACDLPAIVIVGSQDNLTPPRESRVLHRTLPNATLDVVPGAGHQLMLERPGAVTAAIAGLAALAARAGEASAS